MSDPHPPVDTSPSPPGGGGGCLAALMILIGIAMLLPGLCAIILVGLDPKEALVDSSYLMIILTCLAIGAGGVALIWAAAKRPR